MSLRELLGVPISFEVGAETTHAPMVEALVAGTPTRLILDTGSTDHILTLELVERIGLPLAPGEAGTDSVGASVPSWTAGTVPARIGPLEMTLDNVVAIDGPPPFAGWGIGGFLSPQHLHPAAWAVLDLAVSAFSLVEANEDDLVAWLAERHPTLEPLLLDRAAGDTTVLIHGAIGLGEPVLTLLDSGGKRTEWVRSAVPGRPVGAAVQSGRGVGGGRVGGVEVEGQILRVGDVALPVASLFLREEMNTFGGLVGMDLLRGSVLAARADLSSRVIWLVPNSDR